MTPGFKKAFGNFNSADGLTSDERGRSLPGTRDANLVHLEVRMDGVGGV